MANGYLEYNENAKVYRLGLKLFRFGRMLSHRFQTLADFVRPSLDRLASESGNTAFYSIVQGDRRLVVAKAESREGIRFFVEEGESRPLHKGATGKVLLAHNDTLVSEQFLSRFFEKEDDRNKEAFLNELAKTHEAGFSESRGEVTPFGFAIAVPLRTFREDTDHVDALTIAGPLAKLDKNMAQQYRDLLFREKAILEKVR